MATPNKTERKKIKIKSINAPRSIPGRDGLEVTEFMGEDNVKYEVWSNTLVAELKEGGEIDADIVYSVKETEQGVFYHNKITQIYKDGQPVKGRQGGKGYNARDEDRTDARCAAMEIGSCWREGKLEDSDPLVSDYKNWLAGAIKFKPSPTPVPKPATKKVGAKAKTTTDAIPTGGFKNAGEFLKACLDQYGLNRTKVFAELNVQALVDADLNEAWQKITAIYGAKEGGV